MDGLSKICGKSLIYTKMDGLLPKMDDLGHLHICQHGASGGSPSGNGGGSSGNGGGSSGSGGASGRESHDGWLKPYN
jgi:uncharacterized membrane protein YgcG